MSFLADLNARNRGGETVAIPSVCSAHPDVLRATLMLAQALSRPVLIEATSNQVNQFGGYTGQTPDAFIRQVRRLADAVGTDQALLHFGGDHLGPQAWRDEPAPAAMAKAETLMRAYVSAGFTKIHLDCSEGCAGEPDQVGDQVAADRAARLAAICEAAAPDPEKLHYVVGTEVPPPGGARADGAGQGVTPTDPDHARATLTAHRGAFDAAGAGRAWRRVIGLVVQPGLEFAPAHIDHFDPAQPDRLSAALAEDPQICFEAHSTDYQCQTVYPALAARHFSVLKVGPALTFAYRQGLYALDHLRTILGHTGPTLMQEMDALMLAEPGYWDRHYTGTEAEQYLLRHFSYADRIRYYWPAPRATRAVEQLCAALEPKRPPIPVLEQCFPPGIIAAADTQHLPGQSWPRALLTAGIQAALRPYFFA